MKRLMLVSLSVLGSFIFVASPAWAAPTLQNQPAGTLDHLSEVIGALGLFAAMMTILALGTEVVVDALKYVIGLKSKPMTLDAFKELADKLPGQLGDLGLTDEAKQQASTLIHNIQITLKPVESIQAVTEAARSGDLKEAFKTMETLLTSVAGSSISDQLKTELVSIRERLKTGLTIIFERLQLPDSQKQALLGKLTDIDKVANSEAAKTAIFGTLRDIAEHVVKTWMQGQNQTLGQLGREATLSLFRSKLAPELEMLGVDKQAITDIEAQLNNHLAGLSTQTSLYLASAQGLLQAVEDRRQEIQSPLRKLWRKLREYPKIGHGIDILAAKGYPNGSAGLLTWPEALFNKLFKRQPESGTALGEASPVSSLKPTTIAQQLLLTDSRQQDEEQSRLRVLRIISAGIGIWLAYMLQVDAVDILAKSASMFANLKDINKDLLIPILQISMKAGIILSGLAASAGSTYWHDQLDRLQNAKKVVSQVSEITSKLQNKSSEQS